MIKKFIFTSLIACFMASYANPNPVFTLNHQPIAPACIAVFNDTIADPAFITSINLDVCQKQHAADQAYSGNLPGYLSFKKTEAGNDAGYYGYRVIGQTASGIFIVHTNANYGGSGVFSNIILLKLDQAKMFDPKSGKAQTYNRLSYLGQIPGGDRCYSGITDIQLQNNLLSFKQYHGKTAEDCTKPLPQEIILPSYS
jgi:hypothetical protein